MCVIIYTNINNKEIFAKNRDRTYKPIINIVHEIIDGVEIIYFRDLTTGWIEGLNEYGTCMINSSLDNRNRNKLLKNKTKKNPKYLNTHKVKGNYFFDILCDENLKHDIDMCFKKKENCPNMVEGHTLLHVNKECYHIEKELKNKNYHINKLNKNKSFVFTNHGINTDGGYLNGKKGLSSYLRKHIIDNEIGENKLENIDDLLKIMNTSYKNIDPRFHPYRDGDISKKFINIKDVNYVSTTCQLIINITDKIFNYFTDINNEETVKYINNLPKNYIPKIRVNISDTQKNIYNNKDIFSKQKLNRIYKKFNFSVKNMKKNKNKYTQKNTNKGEAKYLFCYGTLKKNFKNHNRIINENYIGKAKTINEYTFIQNAITHQPLLIEKKLNIKKQHVYGELYKIHNNILDKLDKLEKQYVRKIIPVIIHGKKINAYVYMFENKNHIQKIASHISDNDNIYINIQNGNYKIYE